MDVRRERIRRLAERQHGVVAAWQLRETVPPGTLRNEVRRGVLERVHTTVFAIPGLPMTDRRRVMAAVLGAGRGAVASHDTAAAMWGLPQFSLLPVHVSKLRCRNGVHPDGSVRHESRRLPDEHVTVLDGIPLTRPERTVVDLAAVVGPARLERITDHLIAERMVRPSQIRRVREELSAKGRAGLAAIDEVLAERDDDYVPPATGLESRVGDVVRRCGQRVVSQVPLATDDGVARVDFVTEPDGVVIEVQSERWHASLSDRRADEVRIAALRARGHEVVEVWERDVWFDRPKVQALVHEAVRRTWRRRGVA